MAGWINRNPQHFFKIGQGVWPLEAAYPAATGSIRGKRKGETPDLMPCAGGAISLETDSKDGAGELCANRAKPLEGISCGRQVRDLAIARERNSVRARRRL